MALLGPVLKVPQGFTQDVGQGWILIKGSNKKGSTFNLTFKVVGRSCFLETLGIRASISCWLSSGGHPQLLHVAYGIFSMWTFPSMMTCFIIPARKRKSFGKTNIHMIVCVLLPLPCSTRLKAVNQHSRENHSWCEHQILGAILWVLHNNFKFTGKTLIAQSIVGTFPCGTHFLFI